MQNILGFLVILLPIVGSLYGLSRIIKAIKKPLSKYAFGRKDIEQIVNAMEKSQWSEVDQRLKQLNSDDLTQAIDHIAFSCTEKQLKKYLEVTNEDSSSQLIYGAWNLHQAWKLRGYKLASELTEKQINGFFEYLKASARLLEQSTQDNFYSAEAHSRLIRVYMGLGYGDTAKEHFNLAIRANPHHLWSYIHFAEFIQPKWHGSVEEVEVFLNSLPNNDLIKNIVRLKLIYDGIVSGENYFNINAEDLDQFIIDSLAVIDADLEKSPTNSIHRFIVYGYMSLLFENKAMKKKYNKLLAGNYALVPFGIIS